MKRAPALLVTACFFSVFFLGDLNAQDDQAAVEGAPTARELAAAAQKAYETHKKAFEHGMVSTEEVCMWSRRWMTAECDAAEGDVARRAIIEAYCKRAIDFLKMIKANNAASKAPGCDAWSLSTAQYYAVQAQRELDAARRAKGESKKAE
ncbi:MAG: hypothetical protein NTW87_22815 [Planctomycetota bacterium]|nr:hypothetical protein [Planctomycetota bacterium]